MTLKLFSRGIIRRDHGMRTGGRGPLIALTLLEKMSVADVDETLIEMIYDQIRGGPHAKRTFPHRYRSIDESIRRRLAGRRNPIRIHDMAASNGITSVELFEAMRGACTVSVHATDYFDTIRVAAGRSDNWEIVFDVHGEPLQFIGKNWVISATRDSYLINRLMAMALKRFELPTARRRLENDEARTIPLFHPAALKLASREPQFTLGRDDLFSPALASYDLVRVMSAFAGFPESDIASGIAKLGRTIVEDGYFVIGRNRGRHTAEIPTSFFQRKGDRLLLVEEIDGGSELNELVASTRIAEGQ